MKTFERAALLGLALIAGAAAAGVPRADLVLRGGRVYTVDAARSWATAVAIKDGRIVFVGDDRQAAARVGRGTKVVELQGRMVLPGFCDAHMHPVSGGLRLVKCQLQEATTADQLAEAVRACAAASPAGWLIATGWDMRLPIPSAVVADRPAYLAVPDGYTAWVNAGALAAAGIDEHTPDPPGGHIERHADPVTGKPTAILSDRAISLVRKVMPPPGPADYREGLRRALAMANRFGITSLMDGAADPPLLEQYLAADRAGELTAKVVAAHRVDLARGAEQVPELIARRDRFRSGRLRADAAKIFLDGEFHDQTAALLEPYAGAATRGELNLEPAALDALVQRLDAEGFQVQMHTIGDRAVRVALDALARASEVNGPRDRRHHLSHVELVDPADLPRFGRLGVAVDVQPMLGFDGSYLPQVTPLLGPERARRLFPFGALVSSGATVAAGSDWPAPSMNPLEIIQVALTERALHLPELIAAYTITGAWLARSEASTGSIEIGKAADLIVLDRNLFEVPPAELRGVRVLATLLDGRPVYRDPGFPWP